MVVGWEGDQSYIWVCGQFGGEGSESAEDGRVGFYEAVVEEDADAEGCGGGLEEKLVVGVFGGKGERLKLRFVWWALSMRLERARARRARVSDRLGSS